MPWDNGLAPRLAEQEPRAGTSKSPTTRRPIAAILLAVALLCPVSPAGAAPRDCGPGEALENDSVRIWFQGIKGHLKVLDKDGGASYDLKTSHLTEVAADGTELQSMNLERAYPHDTSSCGVETVEGVTTITYGVTLDGVTVVFTFRFDEADDGAKFDLDVDGWPFAAADSSLRFGLGLTAQDGTIVQAASNGVGFTDADGNQTGYVSWAADFTTTYADGHSEAGTTTSQTTVDGSSADAEIAFGGVTSGYEHLTYDPWMGVGPFLVVGPVLLELGSVASLVTSLL